MSERFEVTRVLRFESAHFLPSAPADHKCRRMHGHSFRAEVSVAGPLQQQGWVLDFAELDRLLAPLRIELDHHLLNDVPGLENPTSEEIARWTWRRLESHLPPGVSLSKIVVRETCESAVTYRASSATDG
jgi:6-pyruvoyltetrahydropterin/6-carboxytetrahydropterin synthase